MSDHVLISINNDGPEIAGTNYWTTPHATERGLCYMSRNAGVWRLLVPEQAAVSLKEMGTGKRVSIEPSILSHESPIKCWDIVFDDGSEVPYLIVLDERQFDFRPEAGKTRLTVWTQNGKVLDFPCAVTDASIK